MRWKAPDFEEISLNSEVTAYVNTDDEVRASEEFVLTEPAAVVHDELQPSSV